MSTRSKRHNILTDLEHLIRHLAVDQNADELEDSSTSRSLDELVEIRAEILSARYLHSRVYDTEKRGMVDMLDSYDDKGFKSEVRMDKVSYRIVDMHKEHPIFHNRSRNKQVPAWVQCFLAFRRLGTYGNASSLLRN